MTDIREAHDRMKIELRIKKIKCKLDPDTSKITLAQTYVEDVQFLLDRITELEQKEKEL